MANVIGIGGIFFLCEDVDATRAWYNRVLGIDISDYGGHSFRQKTAADHFPKGARTVWSPFKADSSYFKPSDAKWMINFMVDNLDQMLEKIAAEGVSLEEEPITESYGKFAWIMDPDGIKVELWEPNEAAPAS